jgi:hypothetical protein
MAGIVSEEAGVGRSTEGISSGLRCQSGEALAEWRSSEQVEMEPHQLHHLIGTLMMTMMEVCIGSPYDLLYLYFLLFFFGFLFWLVYIFFFS